MKDCSVCGACKQPTEYYKHPKSSDGLMGLCKDCHKERVRLRREKKAQDPKWVEAELKRHRDKAARYRSEGRYGYTQEHVKSKKEWRDRNTEKRKAHTMVRSAIRRGELTQKPCCVCGSENSQAHHEDYKKPLDVVWYCPQHHGERHVEINRQKREQQNNA